jgi:ABC-type glutathione transport system ATPase component
MIIFDNFSVSDNHHQIIKPLNLELKLPFSYGLIGFSGSGKSTLAKSLSMLLDPKLKIKGSISYKGHHILDLKEKQKRPLRRSCLKYLVQEPFYALNPYLKIKTQLKEVFDHKPHDDELLEALASVELNQARILTAYPHELSGGQRQRIALLQALICQPEVLIADEPTTALDPLVEKQILLLIKKYLQEKKASMLLVSHDLKAIVEMTDKVLVFHEGSHIETLLSHELFTKAAHPVTKSLIDSLNLESSCHAPFGKDKELLKEQNKNMYLRS